jgi:hypothetical protein
MLVDSAEVKLAIIKDEITAKGNKSTPAMPGHCGSDECDSHIIAHQR